MLFEVHLDVVAVIVRLRCAARRDRSRSAGRWRTDQMRVGCSARRCRRERSVSGVPLLSSAEGGGGGGNRRGHRDRHQHPHESCRPAAAGRGASGASARLLRRAGFGMKRRVNADLLVGGESECSQQNPECAAEAAITRLRQHHRCRRSGLSTSHRSANASLTEPRNA